LENTQASVKHFLETSRLQNPFRDNVPSQGWYKSFLRRHFELTERHPEAVTAASSCITEKDIRKWFEKIYDYLTKENYLHILQDPTRIFNSETCFTMYTKLKEAVRS